MASSSVVFSPRAISTVRVPAAVAPRRTFAAGLLAFAATSLACGLATSPVFLVASRAAQGLSAALLAPAALSLLTTTFTEGPERNRALGYFGAATAVGFVAGQVLGGVLTDIAGWRSIFIINVPVGILCAAATRVIPPGTSAATAVTGVLPWLVVIGASFTTAAVATTIAVSAGVAPHEQGMAAALTAGYRLALAIAAALSALGALVAVMALRPVDLGGTAGCAVMEAPRRPGAVYGEEYRRQDAMAVVKALRAGRPIPPAPRYRA
jgi:MFS family permease